MYEHNGYLGHYQTASSFANSTEPISNEIHYEPNTSSFPPNTNNYNAPLHGLDQQLFLPVATDATYHTGPVPGFPQHWLTTPETTLIEAQVEQFQLPPQHDSAPLTPWPSLPNSNSRSSEDGGLPEEHEPGGDEEPNKRKERKEASSSLLLRIHV
jgi:hypothetical protein